jgi:large subunit ribosomal protein L21e
MPHSYGLRRGTRYTFSRGFKNHGTIPAASYLQTYRIGDIVDIKMNGAVQKGMAHKYYHGKTGIIYNVTKSAVGVIVYKVVGNRYLEKRVNVRIEHVKHSKCRQAFVNRVKENAAKKREAAVKGEQAIVKRVPALPRHAHKVSTSSNMPESIFPVAYETTI